MYEHLFAWLERLGVGQSAAGWLTVILMLLIMALSCALGVALAKLLFVRFMSRIVRRTKHTWDDILLEKQFFKRLSYLTLPLVLALFAPSFPVYTSLIERAAQIVSVALLMYVSDALINASDAIYRTWEISRTRPITGFLQVVKVIILIVGIVIIISNLIGESPLVLLGGIGAMTAVTTLVFKDSILGFVAGIQLTSNDMIRIGDWIEMPKYAADGTVVDLTMTTVKVENFDRTITSIPAYALVSDAFINWRGMENSGGRRIKRAIYIDAASVRLCTDDMLENFQKIDLLRDYITEKLAEIAEYNRKKHFDLSEPVNGRRLTNLGTFRAYIQHYLQQHPGIHQGMILMVRQLSAQASGIPLEIYAFTNTTQWIPYENTQSDIFDHLYAVAPRFGLSVFQQPSGQDIRAAAGALTSDKA